MEADLSKIVEIALQQGVWAALYIYLFFKMLKDNAAREEKYQQIINRLSDDIENGMEKIQIKLDVMTSKHSSTQ